MGSELEGNLVVRFGALLLFPALLACQGLEISDHGSHLPSSAEPMEIPTFLPKDPGTIRDTPQPEGPQETASPDPLPPCQGRYITEPTLNGTSGAKGNWYTLRRVHIPLNSTMVFCAPVMEPLVPPVLLGSVDFAIRNERSQNCGAAKITVQPPDPRIAPKDNGFYYSSGGAGFTNHQARNKFRYNDRVPQGVYQITVEATNPHNSGYESCTEWEVSWRAFW